MPILTGNYEVVSNGDIDGSKSGDEPLGDPVVQRSWLGEARWMVVGENH